MSQSPWQKDPSYWLHKIWQTLTGAVGAAAMNLTQVGGVAITLGQKLMAASFPVVIASDQSAVPTNVTQVGGAAVTLGQKAMAASVPVVLASNQSAVPVTFSGTSSVNIAQVGGVALTGTDVPVSEWDSWSYAESPGAGAQVVYVLPAGFEYLIDGVQVEFITDVNVANRQLYVTFLVFGVANINFAPDYNQPLSTTRYYTFAPDVPMSAAPSTAGAFAGTLYIPVPQIQLRVGDSVSVNVTNIQGGDMMDVRIFGRSRVV